MIEWVQVHQSHRLTKEYQISQDLESNHVKSSLRTMPADLDATTPLLNAVFDEKFACYFDSKGQIWYQDLTKQEQAFERLNSLQFEVFYAGSKLGHNRGVYHVPQRNEVYFNASHQEGIIGYLQWKHETPRLGRFKLNFRIVDFCLTPDGRKILALLPSGQVKVVDVHYSQKHKTRVYPGDSQENVHLLNQNADYTAVATNGFVYFKAVENKNEGTNTIEFGRLWGNYPTDSKSALSYARSGSSKTKPPASSSDSPTSNPVQHIKILELQGHLLGVISNHTLEIHLVAAKYEKLHHVFRQVVSNTCHSLTGLLVSHEQHRSSILVLLHNSNLVNIKLCLEPNIPPHTMSLHLNGLGDEQTPLSQTDDEETSLDTDTFLQTPSVSLNSPPVLDQNSKIT